MRGTDSYTEGLFTMRRLDDFVSAKHPLRRIRVMVNEALDKRGKLFLQMYEADINGGRPTVPPEKLLRDAAADPVQHSLAAPAHGSGCRWTARSGCRLYSPTTASA